jgi:hypothetical protein
MERLPELLRQLRVAPLRGVDERDVAPLEGRSAPVTRPVEADHAAATGASASFVSLVLLVVDDSPSRVIGSGNGVRPVRSPPPGCYARPKYYSWADLLRRTFAIDVLACPGCGGRLRLLATIADPTVIAKILRHLGLPVAVPVPAPARQAAW